MSLKYDQNRQLEQCCAGLGHGQDLVREINIDKGWVDPEAPSRDFGTMTALLVSEVGEFVEAHRHPDGPNSPCDKRLVDGAMLSKQAEELADIQVRLFDMASEMGVDLASAFDAKVRYNATRPLRHGGKRA